MSERRFAEAMAVLAAAFDRELTEPLLRVYWLDLQAFEITEIEAAMTHLRRSSKWFPKIAEIRELLLPKALTTEQLAISKWDSVVLAIRDSRNAHSDDLVSDRVVADLGGYIELGRKSAGELVWVQKEFVRRYCAAVESNVAPIRRLRPPGLTLVTGRLEGGEQ